jgi:hypothetical protein
MRPNLRANVKFNNLMQKAPGCFRKFLCSFQVGQVPAFFENFQLSSGEAGCGCPGLVQRNYLESLVDLAKFCWNSVFFEKKIIPTEVALLITAILIGGSVLISIRRTREHPEARSAAEAAKDRGWWLPGSPARADTTKQPPANTK